MTTLFRAKQRGELILDTLFAERRYIVSRFFIIFCYIWIKGSITVIGGDDRLFGYNKKEDIFFNNLCESYYEKILRYLYGVLGDESAARDCTQEVFLTACQKCNVLIQHPNPGGFLFQTAKNLGKKERRQSFSQMLREQVGDNEIDQIPDWNTSIETVLDRQVNEQEYVDVVLSQLTEEKRNLYNLYYVSKNSMADIARILDIEETALRMRYVRLRREIRDITNQIAEQYFLI